MTTNELTKYTIEYMNLHGFTVWRANSGQVHKNVKLAPPGTPDIIGYGPGGRFVGLEIKTGSDSMRETQKEWHAAARDRGVFVAVIHDEMDVKAAQKAYDAGVIW